MARTPLGRFCWYELLTTDSDAARDFYPKVAGWSAESWAAAEPDRPYTVWLDGQSPIGGLMELSGEMLEQHVPPHWMGYVSTPDLDHTLTKANERGAKTVFGPIDVPEVGRVAGFQDPGGAVLGLLQPADVTPGIDGAPLVGMFSWHEAAVEGVHPVYDFYTQVFDWAGAGDFDMGPEMGIYLMFSNTANVPGSHDSIGGMFERPEQMPHSSWIYYIRVESLETALEAVRAGGGQVVLEPMEVPGGDRIAQCTDPQGAFFALHQTRA